MSKCALLALALTAGDLHANLGENNPTGVSGQFNGNVATSGSYSYDPLTGNTTRSIIDSAMPGQVGAYPLAFTRTMNSRSAGIGKLEFGRADIWRHNYQWSLTSIKMRHNIGSPDPLPGAYDMTYPDGRHINFNPAIPDPQYLRGPLGVRDRFLALKRSSSDGEIIPDCYLRLPDGGLIHFVVTISRDPLPTEGEEEPQEELTYTYSLAGLYDPHGLRTEITYTSTSMQIKEPAGRCLTLFYVLRSDAGTNSRIVDRIEEKASETAALNRSVKYNYVTGPNGYAVLDNVVYFDDTSLTARYTYQGSNNAAASNRPLIATCDDSMFPGPMSKIAYDFSPGGAPGQLLREKHIDGTYVSTLAISGNNRTESRGDGPGGSGPSRTFTYSADGLLKTWTDFKSVSSSQNHTAGFVTSSTDARTNTTLFERNARTGNVEKVTHPETPSETQYLPPGQPAPPPQPIATRAYTASCSDDPNNCDPANPYYLYRATDERNFSTFYLRDAARRVGQINYPDNSSETFLYNSLGQIERHRRKNGFYEHFQYDARGLLLFAWNPVASETRPTGSEPKTSFTYYHSSPPHPWQDRVKDVIDARNNVTTYEYETSGGAPIAGRGLVSKIISPGLKERTFSYDRLGNLKRQENELGQPVEYSYDDYSRVRQVKTARPDPSNPSVQDATNPWSILTFDYTPAPGISEYARTTRTPTTITTAANIVTTNVYDANLRLESSTRQNPGGEAATTQFHYDAAGNQDWMIDPNGHKTTADYDQRNRRMKSTSPPVSAEGNTTYVTEWFYDPAGNARLIIQPDTKEQVKTYDALNRLETSADPMNRITTYAYYPSGMLKSVRDPKQQLTQFDYDERDLKTKLIYPNTVEVTGWDYDEVGNMTERPTVGGPKQLFRYDERNRLKEMRWNNAIDFSDFGYDDANRLTSARNPYSTITRGYDVAGRLTLDRQALAAIQNTPALTVQPTRIVSRKTHGAAGAFEIDLPLAGAPGIECRTGGPSYNHTLVLTFPAPVTVSGAAVSSGIGAVMNATANGSDVTVNLTGVSNAQRITIKVYGLNDGATMGEVTIPMHLLVADVNGNGLVDGNDLSMVQQQTRAPVTAANFRRDVNTTGSIDGNDLAMAQANSRSALPSGPLPGPQVDVTYGHDEDGKVTRLSVPPTDYDFTFGYDPMGRFERIYQGTDPGVFYQYFYDKASNVRERRNNLNSTAQLYLPDELNRMKERTIRAISYDSAGAGYLYDFSRETYGYDKMSRLRSTDRVEDGKRDAFGYNDAGELTSADYGLQWNGSAYVNPSRSVSYNLDPAGNREGAWGVNENGMGTPYTPNTLNQYGETTNGTQHEIGGYDGVTYRYLADTFLSSASSTAAGAYELGYDALGRCVKRTTNGQSTYFAFAGDRPIIEYNSSGAITASSVYGLGIDEIIARNNNGQAQFLHQDRLGNTSAVTNIAGEVIEQYRYDAFGAPTIRSGPTPGTGPDPANRLGTLVSATQINNRFLFTGREWVRQFGFYEYRARAYHPGLGRFMSEDPIGFAAGDMNLFRYCAGDPVNFTDPSGLIPPGVIFGAISGSIGGAVSGYYAGGAWGAVTGGVLGGVVGGAVGIFTPHLSHQFGAVAASGTVGAFSSYLGQVAGNYVQHPGNPQLTDLTNVNLGMVAGGFIGGLVAPGISSTVAAAFRNASPAVAQAAGESVSGVYSGSIEYGAGRLWEETAIRQSGGGGGGGGGSEGGFGGSFGSPSPFSPGPGSFMNANGTSAFGPPQWSAPGPGFAVGVGNGNGGYSYTYSPPLQSGGASGGYGHNPDGTPVKKPH